MRIEQRNSLDERRILTAMIVDPTALGKISDKWSQDLFNSKWSNLVGSWCVDYYRRFGKAPGKSIQALFERWAANNKDEKTIALVESFLENLSDQYHKLRKESNTEFILDTAAQHFRRVKLSKLKAGLDADLIKGKIDDAETRLGEYRKIEIGGKAPIDVLRDTEAIKAAFAEVGESLIVWPDPMGDFFKDAFARERFIAFEGPEKRGKTWALLDVAWRGMLSRRRVAFFEVGDLTERQIMLRFMTRAAKRPVYPGVVQWPKGIDDDGIPEYEERKFDRGLSWREAKKACDKILTRSLRTKDTLLRLSCHPNSTISVKGIESMLRDWERDDWIPDIVIVDYADILAVMPGETDPRERHNATWKALKAMSQVWHCCVVTATQAKASSYSAKTLTMEHFGDEKRKHAHVDGMIGLNQDEEEKENGVIRLNWINLREGYYSSRRGMQCAQCLPLAQPFVKAVFKNSGKFKRRADSAR